jgi:hypothetical protein
MMPPKTTAISTDLKERFPDGIPRVEPSVKKEKRPIIHLYREALNRSAEFTLGLDRPKVEGSALVFRLPLDSWSINASVHWRTAEQIHELYGEHFNALKARGKLPPCPNEPYKHTMVRATYYTQKHNDFDNLFSRTKVSLDLIKRAGYIVDDGPEHLRWSEPPRQFVYPWAAPYVVIRLTPVNEFEPIEDEEPIPVNPADVLAAQKRADRAQKEADRQAKREREEAEKLQRAADRATAKAQRDADRQAEKDRKAAEREAKRAAKAATTPPKRGKGKKTNAKSTK